MTKLSWGAIGERIYETGVDHGVLYPNTGDGVPWNGLTSVKEAPTGGEATPYYIDGTKYLNIASAEEFAATIEAFSAPTEFKRCEGIRSMANGLSLGQQRRETFGLSYRTKIGNDVDGQDYGYKLHLVYNALAAPTSRANNTFSDSASPMGLSWDITATPADITLNRPTAHLVIDSTKSNPALLAIVEGFLYGANDIAPRLLTPSQLVAIFEGWDPLNLDIPLNFFGMAEEDSIDIINISSNPSFETDVDAGMITVRTNLAINPNSSSEVGWNTSGYGAGGIGTSVWVAGVGEDGSFGYVQTWTTAATGGGASNIFGRPSASDIPVTAGTVISASIAAKVNQSTSHLVSEVRFFDSSGLLLGSITRGPTVTVSPNEQVRLSVLAVTVPPTAVRMNIAARLEDLTGTTSGLTLIASRPLVEMSRVLGEYFDGNTTPSGDFSYAFSGTPNASSSIQTAPEVWPGGTMGHPTNGSKVYQSKEWASTGISSIAISPSTIGASDTFAGFSFSVIEGHTYTIVATANSPEDTYGGSYARTRTICIFGGQAVTGSVELSSERAPIGIGTVRLTFVALATGNVLARIYSGAMTYVLRWDDLCIIDGEYDDDFFYGDMDSFIYQNQEVYPGWTGSPNLSQSSFKYMTALPSTANEGDAYLITGELWAFVDGRWFNYGTLPGALV